LFVTLLVMVFYFFPSFVFLLVTFKKFYLHLCSWCIFVMVHYYFPSSIFFLVLVLAMVISSPF
jgi:hypothetical protein